MASLYYDTDDQAHPERYRAFRTPPRRTGTLIGQPLDGLDGGAHGGPPPPPPPPLSAPPTALVLPVVVGPVSPPVSPRFDPFGRAAIEYMGAAGAWPPTPKGIMQRQPQQAAGEAAEEEEGDDYGELVRLLTTSGFVADDDDTTAESSPPLALYPGDLRMEPLPFALSVRGRAARYRGRLGCTLPPLLPIVAVASPVASAEGGEGGAPLPATDSTRDLGVVAAPGEEDGEEEGEEEGGGDPGQPVVITVVFAAVGPGAAPGIHATLARLQAVTGAHPQLFTPVLGACCRGDKRRVALVEAAWPAGRPLEEALPLSLSAAAEVSVYRLGTACGGVSRMDRLISTN